MVGRILSINVSKKKGEKKTPVDEAVLIENFGIEGDAHGGSEVRQVSLLRVQDIDLMREKGAKVSFGDFAENLTVEGLDMSGIQIGVSIRVGETLLEVTQIGKVCHDRCNIYKQVGFCVMPEWGIFTRVVKGGRIKIGDRVEVIKRSDFSE